jgi:serine protease AprX
VWSAKRVLLALAFLSVGLAPTVDAASRSKGGPAASRHREAAQPRRDLLAQRVRHYKLDLEVTRRKDGNPNERTRVIVTLMPGAQLPPQFARFARANRKLDIINGAALELPNSVIRQLESRPEIFRVHYDREIQGHNYRTSVTTGAKKAREDYGYTGAGISVAVIDSGITAWHDDLTKGSSSATYPYGNQRVSKFVDFVSGQPLPYDDNGHGTHVAGIISGNGYDSGNARAGAAPGASLVVLKVLDANGRGSISNLIAALNWVAANAAAYNIRVVNMSVGAKIGESYWTDPLTLAAKRIVEQGITIVAAAGNFGRNATGERQWGGITAPGNAPWVLTVGASSTEGTNTRGDDELGAYSSLGPSYIDYAAKPDLVAPGTGTVSLSVPGSTLFNLKPTARVNGSNGEPAYLSLTGTSMAAPHVTGVVAQMLHANPSLTPNLIKAILQYTAQPYSGYKTLEQGAGFVNALGAIRLARFYANNTPGSTLPRQRSWGQAIVWGNHRLKGGYLNPRANAWAKSVVWGSGRTMGATGDNIVWGTLCGTDCDNIVWGTADATSDNVVWGTTSGDNVVWGTNFDDNVVWGTTSSDDNVVWGTDCFGADCDNIVWGTSDDDNIVWGTSEPGDNVVWGTNCVGTGCDNIVWGTGTDDAWGSSGAEADAAVFSDDPTEPEPDMDVELSVPAAEPLIEGGL